MPMIRVQLSRPLEGPARSDLMKKLSTCVAGGLGKPESYMMVVMDPEVPMMMSANEEPAALVEVRSVGTISGQQARDLNGKISALISEAAGISSERIYANFIGVPGAMWGYSGGTFG